MWLNTISLKILSYLVFLFENETDPLFSFCKIGFLLSWKQLLVYQFLFASSHFNPKNYFTKLMSCCKKTWWKMVVFPWHLGVRGKLKYIERCLNGYLFLLCTFLNQIYPLLICTGFLKYPFRHLFQTEIKIDFKTNWFFFQFKLDFYCLCSLQKSS